MPCDQVTEGLGESESEGNFQLVFENAAEGMLLADLESRKIIRGNRAACRMLGYDAGEIAALNALAIQDAAHWRRASEAQAGGGPLVLRDVALTRKDGSTFKADVRTMPALFGGRRCLLQFIGSAIGVSKDIAERKRMEDALRTSQERYHELFAKSKLPMLLINPDGGAIVEANAAACSYYGYDERQLKRLRISDINALSPEQVQAEMHHADREERDHFYFRHRLADGRVRDVEVHSGPLEINGRHVLYSVIHDITARKRAERLLKESEARFRHIMEHAPLGIAITDLEGRFIQANQALCDIVGVSRAELERGKTIGDITHPEDTNISNCYMQRMIVGRLCIAKYEKRYIRKDGKQLWVQISAALGRDWSGRPLYFIHLMEDISKRKEAEQRIDFLAHHDTMTGFPNRELFLDRFSRSIARARRSGKLLALFFLDLDEFKTVNDTYGHDAGDAVLKSMATRIAACVRDVDTVARLGGDEFAIVFDELDDPLDVAPVAEKIIRQLSEPLVLAGGRGHRVGVSIGIAIYPNDGVEFDHLMRAADVAMYASKRRGKNTYSYYDGGACEQAGSRPWITLDDQRVFGHQEIDAQHAELVHMVNDLNDAVRRGEPVHELTGLFDELVAHTKLHFAFEEQVMDECGYPEEAMHKSEHERLLEEAVYLREELARGGELLVLQSIKDWLLAHTIDVDKPFVEYVNRHGAG